MFDKVFYADKHTAKTFGEGRTIPTRRAAVQAAIAANQKAPLVGTFDHGFRHSNVKSANGAITYIVTGYYRKGQLVRAVISPTGTVLKSVMPEVYQAEQAETSRKLRAAITRFRLTRKGAK